MNNIIKRIDILLFLYLPIEIFTLLTLGEGGGEGRNVRMQRICRERQFNFEQSLKTARNPVSN